MIKEKKDISNSISKIMNLIKILYLRRLGNNIVSKKAEIQRGINSYFSTQYNNFADAIIHLHVVLEYYGDGIFTLIDINKVENNIRNDIQNKSSNRALLRNKEIIVVHSAQKDWLDNATEVRKLNDLDIEDINKYKEQYGVDSSVYYENKILYQSIFNDIEALNKIYNSKYNTNIYCNNYDIKLRAMTLEENIIKQINKLYNTNYNIVKNCDASEVSCAIKHFAKDCKEKLDNLNEQNKGMQMSNNDYKNMLMNNGYYKSCVNLQ